VQLGDLDEVLAVEADDEGVVEVLALEVVAHAGERIARPVERLCRTQELVVGATEAISTSRGKSSPSTGSIRSSTILSGCVTGRRQGAADAANVLSQLAEALPDDLRWLCSDLVVDARLDLRARLVVVHVRRKQRFERRLVDARREVRLQLLRSRVDEVGPTGVPVAHAPSPRL